MSCGVGCRGGSDPALPCLWCRLVATVPTGPLAWEAPYAAVGVALPKKNWERENQRQGGRGAVEAGKAAREAWEGGGFESAGRYKWAPKEK